jgi:hypothetical protein
VEVGVHAVDEGAGEVGLRRYTLFLSSSSESGAMTPELRIASASANLQALIASIQADATEARDHRPSD